MKKIDKLITKLKNELSDIKRDKIINKWSDDFIRGYESAILDAEIIKVELKSSSDNENKQLKNNNGY